MQLAEAKVTVARLRCPLEEAGFRTVADLDRAVVQLHLAADELAVLARDYRYAANEAARLSRAAGAR